MTKAETCTDKLTGVLRAALLEALVRTVSVSPSATTVMVNGAEVDAMWVASPAYCAVIVWFPIVENDAEQVADPPVNVDEHSCVVPLEKVTVPVGVA